MGAAALVAAALLLSVQGSDAPAGTAGSTSAAAPARWRFAGFPLLSYGSDVGLELGAALFLYRTTRDSEADRDTLALTLSYATNGPRQIDADVTFRRFLGSPLRFRGNLHLADNRLMPYWGEGAQLGGVATPPGYGTPPPPYRYHDRRAFGAVAVSGAIAGPFGWHVRGRWIDVDVADPSALLAASDPPGAQGGRVALGEVGLFLDTRDRELAPSLALAAPSPQHAPRIAGEADMTTAIATA